MQIQEHIGTVTQKGQVTIPLAVRKLLGVKPADRVSFRVIEGRVELASASMSLEAAFGAVKPLTRSENWSRQRGRAREERVHRRTRKHQRAKTAR